MVSDGDFWDQRIECMARDELASLQLERLKWQVRRCYRDSEFYRERLDAAGVGPIRSERSTTCKKFLS